MTLALLTMLVATLTCWQHQDGKEPLQALVKLDGTSAAVQCPQGATIARVTLADGRILWLHHSPRWGSITQEELQGIVQRTREDKAGDPPLKTPAQSVGDKQ